MKVLVLGDGVFGTEIVKQSGWKYMSRKKDNINLSDFKYWKWKLINYDVIVNCIAHTDTYSDDRHLHWDSNYKFVDELASFCSTYSIKLVHIGTDYMYAGNKKENPTEDDVPVHAENWYSYTKLLGDAAVQLHCKNYLICRLTHKPYPFPYESAYTDRISNFDYTDVIAGLVIKLINKNAAGVFNIGTETKSVYDLALKYNPNVKKANVPDGFPKNTSMSIEKMKKVINDKI